MGPLIMLYHIELFEYTLSQFCSRFTLLLELEWPNSWDSKIGDFCEETVLPMCDFWPGCVEYLTHCLWQLPLHLPCLSTRFTLLLKLEWQSPGILNTKFYYQLK